jgi:hypothetical protein
MGRAWILKRNWLNSGNFTGFFSSTTYGGVGTVRKKIIFILIILLAALATGCGGGNRGEAGITGYVMKIEEGRILVIGSEAQNFSSTGGVEAFYDAIWFSNVPEDILIGQKVKVWFDMVMDSYPGQSEAKHVEVIPSQKPAGADLYEEEALYKALTSEDIKTSDVLVVESIEFDKENNLWTVKLQELWSETTFTLEIIDQ